MRLKRPTDFDILGEFLDGENNLAVNLASELDRDRSYINTRLPDLEDYGLLEKIGPAPNSGLYRITPAGVAAFRLRNDYATEDWEERVAERAENIDIRRPEIIDELEPED